MPIQKLKEFLDRREIKYVLISHSVAYAAQGIAALTHISGKELAKTVIVKIDGAVAMAVLPAYLHVDLPHLKAVAGRVPSWRRKQNSRNYFPTARPELCLPSATFTMYPSSPTRA